LLEIFEDGCQGTLVAFSHVLVVVVEDEFVVLFVYGVVSEMHAYLIDVVFGWRLVEFCGKSGEAFVIEE
jgi:hypothetical protein